MSVRSVCRWTFLVGYGFCLFLTAVGITTAVVATVTSIIDEFIHPLYVGWGEIMIVIGLLTFVAGTIMAVIVMFVSEVLRLDIKPEVAILYRWTRKVLPASIACWPFTQQTIGK